MPAEAALKLRPADPYAAPRPAALDVKAREALVAEAAAELSDAARHRRGPMRPKRLVSARERTSGAMAVRLFRLADVALVAGLCVGFAEAALPGAIADAPVGAVLPFFAAAVLALWSSKALEVYRFGRTEALSSHQAKLACAFVLAGAAVLPFTLWLGGGESAAETGAFLLVAFAASYLAHLRWWTLVRRWRDEGKLTPNVLLVGATRHAERLIRRAMDNRDMNILGVFDDRLARAPGDLAGVPVLGDTAALVQHKLTPYVDRIVVAVDPSAKTRVRELVERLKALPNEVSLIVDVDDPDAVARAGDTPLARVSGGGEDERRAFAKRVQDVAIGTAALVCAAPAMLLIALLIKLDSPGPVFFRQRRHGFNNEEILVWKFRSMRVETADARAERQVTADDDRVTRVGRFIRKTSLDELPQLFNVLKGEMSLVGPRPHAIGMKTGGDESARLVAEYAWRHRIKPGMTGWAAIHGSRGPLHSAEDVKRRVALDVEYVQRQSLWLDLRIMALTLPCLLGDRDAVR
jgi:Undecaprenyl-phosphate glucose phosphotransferase